MPRSDRLRFGTKNLLDNLRASGFDSGFRAAAVVGPGGHDSYFLRELVGGVSQRLVLTDSGQGIAYQHIHNAAASVQCRHQHRSSGLLMHFTDKNGILATGRCV